LVIVWTGDRRPAAHGHGADEDLTLGGHQRTVLRSMVEAPFRFGPAADRRPVDTSREILDVEPQRTRARPGGRTAAASSTAPSWRPRRGRDRARRRRRGHLGQRKRLPGPRPGRGQDRRPPPALPRRQPGLPRGRPARQRRLGSGARRAARRAAARERPHAPHRGRGRRSRRGSRSAAVRCGARPATRPTGSSTRSPTSPRASASSAQLREERDRAQRLPRARRLGDRRPRRRRQDHRPQPRRHELLGYREGELLGRDWFKTCLPVEQREELRAGFDRFVAGEVEFVEAAYENEVITAQASCAPSRGTTPSSTTSTGVSRAS